MAGKRVAVRVVRGLKLADEHGGRECGRACGLGVEANYCRHGVFVGDPHGPDFMCGYCETGVSDYEFALGIAGWEQDRNARAFRQRLSDAVVGVMREDREGLEWLTPDEVTELIRTVVGVR